MGLVELASGLDPNLTTGQGSKHGEKFYETKNFHRVWFSVENFILGPAGPWGGSQPGLPAREQRGWKF